MSPSPFESLSLGSARVPNRFFLAPVKTALGGANGEISPRHLAYYRRRAQGGAGTLISEPLFVDRAGKEHPKQLGIDDDGKVPGLRSLVQAIHDEGAHAVAHLNHAGRAANPKASGCLPEAPSAVACPTTGATPQALALERIVEVEGRFVQAAVRAQEAGFDGVEIQLGLGYLAAQFLSPRTNQRQDEYGVTGEGRWRFAERVVRGVRAVLSSDRYLIVRLSAEERVEGGLGLEDAIELGRRARSWGADAIHVVTGSACDSPAWYYQHMSLVEGVNEKLAGRIREDVGGPVIVAGRMGDPARIRALIGAGQIDAVALGRPLLADPDLPRKMMAGRDDSIQLCGGCLQGCLAKVKEGGPIGCIVNPAIGREDEVTSLQGRPKHVVIVGGGPAGLQAAITASERGHRVTLLEKGELGGQFGLSFLSPGKEAMRRVHDTLLARLRQAPIELRTGVEATEESVLALEPDVVVVATGSVPTHPPIPGMERAWHGADVLTGRVKLGKRALVVGGGLVGIELADYLGLRGIEVVVVEALAEIARDMEAVTRKLTLKRLAALPVTILMNTKVVAVRHGEALVQGEGDDTATSLGSFDMLVFAVGGRAVDELSSGLRRRGTPVHVIGDALKPAQVWDATRAGYEVAELL